MLLYGRGLEHAFKVGNFNSHGWIAYTLGNVLFVKRFNAEREGSYPDMGCNIEAYVRDSFLELETLGPLKTLNRNESVTHEETWEVHVGAYPLTLEGTRNVSRQLSLH
jgi:hypothetical protein